MAIPVEFLSGEHSDSNGALVETLTKRSSMGPKCEICNSLRAQDPEVVKIHLQVRSGELSQKQAADRLNISYAYFNRHYVHHMRNEIQQATMPLAEELARKEIDTLEIMTTRLGQINERLVKWLHTPIGDPRIETAIKLLASEVRQFVEIIEKMQGNLTTSPIVQLNQFNIEMQKLETLVFEDLCPTCKIRLANRIGKEITV